MKAVCSFCNTEISPGTSPDDPVTHGVCPACYKRILADHGFNVKKILNQLDAPVFLVDADVNILAANASALALAGKPIALVQDTLCGDVLDCINAFQPDGCGRTALCPDCTFRNTVNETYATGRPVTRRPAALIRKTLNTSETLDFLVSTWKDGNVVMLRLRPVRTG